MFKMKNLVLSVCFVGCLVSSKSQAASGSGFGINVGLGVPFVTQAGVNYTFSDQWSMSFGYNLLSIDVGTAKAELSMPELLVHWHPFSGSFFAAAGLGSETMSTSATDATTGQKAEIKVVATATVLKLGWMWGASDGGFWYGIDMSMISPSSPKTTITSALPTTNEAYIDAEDAADKFGSTAFTNLTFFRLGYLF